MSSGTPSLDNVGPPLLELHAPLRKYFLSPSLNTRADMLSTKKGKATHQDSKDTKETKYPMPEEQLQREKEGV